MCEPVTLISAGISAAGQVVQHQAENQAIEGRNRAKLKNFDRENKQYLDDIMFDNVQYQNEQLDAEIEFDANYQNLVDSWVDTDNQLDDLYREADFNLEEAVIDMYESDYAGTQTGRTAMRLAADNQRKLGQYKSRILHDLMLAREDAWTQKESAHRKADKNQRDLYNSIRFSPVVPPPPSNELGLEGKKGSAGLLLGLAGTAIQGVKDYKEFKAKDIGSGKGKSKGGYKKQPPTKSERLEQRIRNYERGW